LLRFCIINRVDNEARCFPGLHLANPKLDNTPSRLSCDRPVVTTPKSRAT